MNPSTDHSTGEIREKNAGANAEITESAETGGATGTDSPLTSEDNIAQIQEQVLEAEQAAKDSEDLGSIGHINQEAVVQESLKLPIILIGSLIYSFGINVFLKPLHLYSGGFMGMCQLIQTLLQDYVHIIPKNADITGILYWILNAPALAYAYKKMRRRFFYKSIFPSPPSQWRWP